MNNITFDGMPQMSGKWFNFKTGDSFTVKDSFFENEKFVVSTTDGRIIPFEKLTDYVKAEKPSEIPAKTAQSNPIENELPSEVKDILEDTTGLGNINYNDSFERNTKTSHALVHQDIIVDKEEEYDDICIDKALKNRPLPKINITIEWPDFPKKELTLLKEVLNIADEQIRNWYIRHLSTTDMMNNVESEMKKEIDKYFTPAETPEPIKSEPIKSEPKTKTKKTKK